MRTKETTTDKYKTVHYYDDNELNIRTTDYDENGKMLCDIHYHHNQQNQCDSWRVFNSDGNIIYRFEADYDEIGREKEIRQFNKQNILEMRTVSDYDENGLLISETHFDGEGKKIESDDL